MITLSHAFKLCDIKNQIIYFQSNTDKNCQSFGFWSENVRKYMDMKKNHVLRIKEKYFYDGSHEILFVLNISKNDLQNIDRKMHRY